MFKVKETRREAPVRVLVHGAGGVGKSTFGAAAPKAIFLAAEDGLINIDARAVEPAPKTWAQVIEALDWLADGEAGTVVIDSLDWLEPLCWEHVCRAHPKKYSHIEEFGYGKGYLAALDQWRVFLNKLSALHEDGSRVVLIAHSVRKMVKNPEGDDYEAWQIKLHEKAAGLIKEWVDVVGFATHEIVTEDTSGRAKGRSTGRRILKTNPTAAYEAKTRYALPRILPLDWQAFEGAIRSGPTPKTLRAELDAKLVDLDDAETTEQAHAFLKVRGETVASLSEALETVNTIIAERATRKAS